MPTIELSVEIEAPVADVYRVARNVEAFPEFMADLESLTVLERSADDSRTVTAWVAVIREFKMKIRWTQEDLWNDTTYRDDFKQLQGDMDKMGGYWQFTPLDASRTRFDSVLEYEYDVPLIGPMIKSLIKKKMTDNLQATLDAIKRKAEEGA
jgi:uncharacterized membrane protein